MHELVTQVAVAGAQIKVCRKLDVDCAMPVATAVSDVNGSATFAVPMDDFAGYLLVDADGKVPTLDFFNPAIDRDQTLPPVSLPTPEEYMGLLSQLGQQPSPGHGSIVISSEVCTGAPAGGVHYATANGDSMTAGFYTVGILPTTSATATNSADGYGGLINVPAGAATVTGTLENPHADLGTISLLVRDGAITYTRFVPLGN